MNTPHYYPSTLVGRAEWWDNILLEGPAALASIGLLTGPIAAIMNDARWGVYLYRTLPETFDEAYKAIVAYRGQITGGVLNGPLPMPPDPAPWPTLPTPAVLCGIEARREVWVADAKLETLYTSAIGILLKLEATVAPFVPATYQADLFGLDCLAPRTLTGKFRKAYGNIDGINLYGRKEGAPARTFLGRFNATPFNAHVPLAGSDPEAWEFRARAVIDDVEIGLPSAILSELIRG